MEELDNIELKDIPQSETIANEEDQETKTTENSSTPKTSKGKKKKLIIIGRCNIAYSCHFNFSLYSGKFLC